MTPDLTRPLTPPLALTGFLLIGSLTSPALAQKRPELLLPSTPVTSVSSPQSFCSALGKGTAFTKTELYFGLAKPDGSIISDAELGRFVDQTITPRFPAGLTLLTAIGQFRSANGTLVKESSRLIILLYPVGDRDSASNIETIRTAYKQAFQQESVLRVDSQACIAF